MKSERISQKLDQKQKKLDQTPRRLKALTVYRRRLNPTKITGEKKGSVPPTHRNISENSGRQEADRVGDSQLMQENSPRRRRGRGVLPPTDTGAFALGIACHSRPSGSWVCEHRSLINMSLCRYVLGVGLRSGPQEYQLTHHFFYKLITVLKPTCKIRLTHNPNSSKKSCFRS